MSEALAKHGSMIDLDEFERRLQRPASSGRGDGDPLAELARLVGSTEDPYRGMFDVPAQPQRTQPAFADWDEATSYSAPKNHPLAGDFAAIEAGLLRGALPDQQDWVHDPSAYQVDFPAVPDDAAWAPPYAEKPRSRKPLFLTAAVIVLGLGGIGASFALKGHVGGPREITTIAAVPGPTKIQPATPDGVDVPNQDATILDKSPRPNAVALSSNREQPVDLSRLPERGQKVLSVGNAPLTGSALSEQQVATAGSVSPPGAPTSIASLIEPRKVRTVSVRPDGTVLPNDVPPQQASGTAPRPAGSATPVAKPSTPKSTARVQTTPKPVATPPVEANAPMQISAKPKPSATPAKPVRVAAAQPADDGEDAVPAAATTNGGGFAVQLAAPGSERDAKDAISKFSAKFASELGGRRPAIRKAMVGDKDVFRVRVVNLSRDEATALCQKLQAGGGSCFVAKN